VSIIWRRIPQKKGHIPSFQRTISTIFAIIHYLFFRRKILFLVIDGIFRA
jgi:hypothetical protein